MRVLSYNGPGKQGEFFSPDCCIRTMNYSEFELRTALWDKEMETISGLIEMMEEEDYESDRVPRLKQRKVQTS